jgi:hypothetical protein
VGAGLGVTLATKDVFRDGVAEELALDAAETPCGKIFSGPEQDLEEAHSIRDIAPIQN